MSGLHIIISHTPGAGGRGLATHLASSQGDADTLELAYGAKAVAAATFTPADVAECGRHALIGEVLVEAREAAALEGGAS